MKMTVTRRVEVEVDTLRMVLPVRYDDEDMPYDFPLRKGDVWSADVDLGTHRIKGWPTGQEGRFFMKVCDEGVYTLLAAGKVVAEKDGYVPNEVVPGEDGDYVELEIAGDGTIMNWPKHPDLSQFNHKEDE